MKDPATALYGIPVLVCDLLVIIMFLFLPSILGTIRITVLLASMHERIRKQSLNCKVSIIISVENH